MIQYKPHFLHVARKSTRGRFLGDDELIASMANIFDRQRAHSHDLNSIVNMWKDLAQFDVVYITRITITPSMSTGIIYLVNT